MGMTRVLAAYDGSEAAFRALELAAETAAAELAGVDLVVVGTPEMADPEAVAREAVAFLVERGFHPRLYVRYGDPAAVIRTLASDEGYEAVYLGTRGHTAHLVDGRPSVSGAVVERSAVTTVVAR